VTAGYRTLDAASQKVISDAIAKRDQQLEAIGGAAKPRV
jgi:hypothetical protein